MKFADIVINRPIEEAFTYSIPEYLEKDICVGSVVEVSFGSKMAVGYVVGLSNECAIERVKPISGVIDSSLCVDARIMELAKWISNYYYCSWGEAISAVIPSVVKKASSGKSRNKEEHGEEGGESEFIDGSDKHLTPTPEQKEALGSIINSMDASIHKVFLLHGVTGSGKTEVYLQSIAHALDKGLSSIVLVPEISLTPQTVARFRMRFKDKIAVLHSRLLGSKRISEWRRISSGEARIIVGARSAVFAPVKNLGLIVVDEEHETSYKQEDVPRYNARDTAIKRAELSNAVVILGSATPSLESFYAAKNGKYSLIELPERIDSRLLPEVDIVDMREEMTRAKKIPIFSQKLKEWIEKDIAEKKQVILFLNRRGFSTFVTCKKCGYVIRCKRCSVSLTYHFDKKKLACHHCGFTMDPPEICPECNAGYLRYWGLGTEKVESEAHRLFPSAEIARLDTDATHKRGSHDKVLSKFKDARIDILIGTQMIAKGLDFPKVTLVGVISADTALNLPDFRSSERTFNLLTQVAGRAGRSDLGGRVIIQSYNPQHYSIQAAKTHDYNTFYDKEIYLRKELYLPPFCHMVNLTVRGRKEERVFRACDNLKNDIEKADKAKNINILGPAPSPISKMKGFYRWNIFLRAQAVKDITCILKKTLGKNKISGIIVTVDVDPS
ncbi:MAG: primosomal protein N' [Candidatus Omnitrophota bacterium]|jgi:primosomal protein N' (replication factor Y)